jgi:hypothetical protein
MPNPPSLDQRKICHTVRPSRLCSQPEVTSTNKLRPPKMSYPRRPFPNQRRSPPLHLFRPNHHQHQPRLRRRRLLLLFWSSQAPRSHGRPLTQCSFRRVFMRATKPTGSANSCDRFQASGRHNQPGIDERPIPSPAGHSSQVKTPTCMPAPFINAACSRIGGWLAHRAELPRLLGRHLSAGLPQGHLMRRVEPLQPGDSDEPSPGDGQRPPALAI